MSAVQQIDIPAVEGMLKANPRDGGVWSTLGVLQRRKQNLQAAVACHRRGLEYAPELSAVWSNLGNALLDLGRFDAAVEAHRRACALDPGAQHALFNHAIALRKAGAFIEALNVLKWMLDLKPGEPSSRWEKALTLLQVGEYRRGLAEYEIRRAIPAYRNRTAPGPMWDGGRLDGKTIYLSTEQGFGDALLMLRYIPLVAALGGRIILETHEEQRRLLQHLPVSVFLTNGSPFPQYDVQASLMSLPYLLGSTIDSLPPPPPLFIPQESREKAEKLTQSADGVLKVGVVWSGRVTFSDNARRACTLSRFLRFAEIPGVRLFSLQKGPPEAQLDEMGASQLVTPLGPHFTDFADTAACIEKLDLVIMTDSSVAHLAGSLGRPIWNLVQYVPYWIYGAGGDRTPWYPSMRLFRQGKDEDWEPVFEQAAHQLAELAARRRQAASGRAPAY
jgi:tetratricopeptide (TPR) repeat protein